MAGHGAPLLRASAFAAAIDGSITIVANRGRDVGLAQRGIEDDDAARGWSSAVQERGLALRRRGGSTSCSRPHAGLVVREEAAAPGAALGAGAGAKAAVAAAEKPLVDPGVAFFCLTVL